MRFLKVLLGALIFVIALLFFVQNNEMLSQHMAFRLDLYVPGLAWTAPELPFFFILLGFLFLGAFFATAFLMLDRCRMSSKLRSANRQVKKLQKEIQSLRNIPLTGSEVAKENT